MSRQMNKDGDFEDLPGLFYTRQNNAWALCEEDNANTTKHPFFRKYFNEARNERAIAKIIQTANAETSLLIRIYNVTKDYYDAELLDKYHDDKARMIKQIKRNLQKLHEHNVVYVDLKDDNMGYSTIDKRWKLYDFDCSGVIRANGKWKIEAPYYFQYKRACKTHTQSDRDAFDVPKCDITPLEIDAILFNDWKSHARRHASRAPLVYASNK